MDYIHSYTNWFHCVTNWIFLWPLHFILIIFHSEARKFSFSQFGKTSKPFIVKNVVCISFATLWRQTTTSKCNFQQLSLWTSTLFLLTILYPFYMQFSHFLKKKKGCLWSQAVKLIVYFCRSRQLLHYTHHRVVDRFQYFSLTLLH